MAEGEAHAVSALVRKRAEIAGQITHARTEAARLQAKLATIDAALEMFDPAIRAELIAPKRYRPPADGPYVEVGGRALLEFLRRTEEPLDAREIAARLLVH